MTNELNRLFVWEDGDQWFLSRWPRKEKMPAMPVASKAEAERVVKQRSDDKTQVTWEA